jgi:hypothetical protein
MSFKLVKKMIQETEELEELTYQGHLSKKRKRAKEEVVVPLTKNELLQRHIQSKIRLDQTLSARSSASKQTVDRLEAQRKKQSKLRSKAIVKGGVGNSRGSAYQKSHEHHEPTFNKKRHREEKKERMLRDIAKLLNKTKKSTK